MKTRDNELPVVYMSNERKVNDTKTKKVAWEDKNILLLFITCDIVYS